MSYRFRIPLALVLVIGLGRAANGYETGGDASDRRVAAEVTGLDRADALAWLARTVATSDSVVLRDWADGLAGIVATTTLLDVSVESGGSNVITVTPGVTVHYEVVGALSDDAHQGLALFGVDLVFDGGDLEHANIPTGEPTPGCDNPMINFTRPWGITNPDSPCPPACGFGGTIINGDLIQVSGGQNTINNTPDNAPFPIGPVLLGVAQPGGCGPAVLVTGSLTAPVAEGTYTLSIPETSVFGNVISLGEVCNPNPLDPSTFCPVDAAGVGTITNLTIEVVAMTSPAIAWVPIGTGPNGELPAGATIDGNEITIYTDGQTTYPVFLELRIGDWDPDDTGVLLRAWQGALDTSIFTGEPDALKPYEVPCATDSDCIDPFGGFCTIMGNACAADGDCQYAPMEYCQGSTCNYPIVAAEFCEPGWIFCGRELGGSPFGCEPQVSISLSNGWRWSAAVSSGNGMADPEPFPEDGMYAGSLVLETPASAEGTFTMGLLPPPNSALFDQNYQHIIPIGLVPARITLIACGGGDCQPNGTPDECDLIWGTSDDCNGNGVPDECDVTAGTSPDCNANLVPDECELDCNGSGFPDDCDIADGTSFDCGDNGIPDECELDCQDNCIPDDCEILAGESNDDDGDGVPDECAVPGPAGFRIDLAPRVPLESEPVTVTVSGTFPDSCYVLCDAVGYGASSTEYHVDFYVRNQGTEPGVACLDVITTLSSTFNLSVLEPKNYLVTATLYVTDWDDPCENGVVTDQAEAVLRVLADCNGNGAADSCDLTDGTSEDCNVNEVPDDCEPDCDGSGVPDDCECLALDTPAPEPAAILKNRYLSFVPDPSGSGCAMALRVTLGDLPPPFDSLSGSVMWVSKPRTYSENAGTVQPAGAPGFPTFRAAILQCDPYYTDWSDVETLHVYHPAIVPGAVNAYSVQSIEEGCDVGMTQSYSPPWTMTTSGWADVAGYFDGAEWVAPDGSINVVADVLAILGKFTNQTSAVSKARADIHPATPDQIVGILDATSALNAFRGHPYPFPPPDPCP